MEAHDYIMMLAVIVLGGLGAWSTLQQKGMARRRDEQILKLLGVVSETQEAILEAVKSFKSFEEEEKSTHTKILDKLGE